MACRHVTRPKNKIHYSLYGKRSLPHFGYGHTRTQYTRYSDARDVTSSRLAALYPVDIPRGVCVL